jgi:hypothetical protein
MSAQLEGNIMNKLNTIDTVNSCNGKWVLAAALTAALLAGCGGGGGGETTEARGIDQNVSDLIAYMKGLIAMDENTLVVDDKGDPAPL